MSTPIELKVDRIEKMLIEVIEMVGRLDGKIEAVETRLSARMDALSEELKQMRSDQVSAHKEAMMRFITYEEDLRRLRMEFRMLEERMRALEDKSGA
jgi:hypothetical protein